MSLATEYKYSMCCDWLSFTYKPDISKALTYNLDRTYSDQVHTEFDCFILDFPEIAEILEDSCFLRCRSHYDHVLAFDDWFRISYNDDWTNSKNGVNVQIPSHGLERFCNLLLPDYDGKNILQDLLKLLYLRSCQLSRIDLAFDDYTKRFTPKNYMDWYNNNQISTRCKSGSFHFSEAGKGHSFYLGSRRTKIMRIYDKEYESNGEIKAIRYEWEFHGTYAKHIQQTIIKNGYISFHDLILETMDVKIDCDDKIRSRRPRLPEWDEFIKVRFCEEFERFEFPKFKKSPSVEKLNNYIENNVMPCLTAFVKLQGKDGFIKLREMINSTEISNRYLPFINRVLDSEFIEIDQKDCSNILANPPDHGKY